MLPHPADCSAWRYQQLAFGTGAPGTVVVFPYMLTLQGQGKHMRTDVMLAVALMAVISATQVQAQQVYKCVEGGRTEYRSMPCENGPPVRTWDVEVAPRSADIIANEQRIDAMRREVAARQAQPRQGSRPAATMIHFSQHRGPERCARAKAQRDAAYRNAGHRRSFALSRQMDDLVYDACK